MQVRMIKMFMSHLENMYQRSVTELEACMEWSRSLAISFRKRHPNEVG